MQIFCECCVLFIIQPYKSWLAEFEKQASEASNNSKEVSTSFNEWKKNVLYFLCNPCIINCSPHSVVLTVKQFVKNKNLAFRRLVEN